MTDEHKTWDSTPKVQMASTEEDQFNESSLIDIADWLLQIEKKMAVLINSQEYELATAKSTSTSYQMLKRLENDLSWQEIKKKLEEVYSILMEVHTISDLHREQRPDETLQAYIHNFTDLTEKAMGAHPHNITNRVIIFLFIKNLYNCDIQKCIAGPKTINTLADAFKLADQSLLKLKKYEGLLHNEEYEVSEIQK